MENIPLAWSGRCCWLVVKIIKKFGLHCFFLNNLLIYNLTLSAFFSHFKKLFIRIAKQERKNFLNRKLLLAVSMWWIKCWLGNFLTLHCTFLFLLRNSLQTWCIAIVLKCKCSSTSVVDSQHCVNIKVFHVLTTERFLSWVTMKNLNFSAWICFSWWWWNKKWTGLCENSHKFWGNYLANSAFSSFAKKYLHLQTKIDKYLCTFNHKSFTSNNPLFSISICRMISTIKVDHHLIIFQSAHIVVIASWKIYRLTLSIFAYQYRALSLMRIYLKFLALYEHCMGTILKLRIRL